jgi:hypothetical protein
MRAIAVLLLVKAMPSHALEGDWSWGGGAVMASIPTLGGGWGVGGPPHARYGRTDPLKLNAGFIYSYHFPAPIGPEPEEEGAERPTMDLHVMTPHIGIVYALDIIEVVPYLLLDASFYVADWPFFGENDRRWGAGMMFGVGFDYRRWKTFSLGAEAAYHAFFSDLSRYPVYLNINLHFSYHYDAPF